MKDNLHDTHDDIELCADMNKVEYVCGGSREG